MGEEMEEERKKDRTSQECLCPLSKAFLRLSGVFRQQAQKN